MTMKTYLAMLLALLMLFACVSCGNSSGTSSTATPSEPPVPASSEEPETAEGTDAAEAPEVPEAAESADVAPENQDANTGVLKAGAGNGEIVMPAEMFPLDGLNGVIHDSPYARVLVLETNIKVAIVSVELVSMPDEIIKLCQQIVSEKTGTPEENVWVHTTHAVTTPHWPGAKWGESLEDQPEEVIAQYTMYKEALTAAMTEAAEEAADSFQPAVAGIGTGTCDVNANRDIVLNGEQYYGLGSTEPSNKTMTILRLDTLDGNPLGFFISYGIKPTAIDNVELDEGTRQVSTDVPGLACRMMEEEFGVPAMFCMPAAGDQIPRETTTYYELKDGEAVLTETSVEDGLEIVDRLGTEMGDDAISIAKSISCTESDQVIDIRSTSFTWSSTNKNSGEVSESDIAVSAIKFGDDLAFVGFQPELNCTTELELWEVSPFEHTLLISYLNGENKYMPDAHAYEVESWEYKSTTYNSGAAEELVATAVELLESMK